MAGFDELGLNETLIANVHEAGFDAPSAVQRALIPVLRRGGNAIIHASSGSGITTAHALALLDRFANQEGTKALVIVPTADRAERVAGTIAGLAHGTSARVAALTSGWSAAGQATIVVAAAEKLLAALETSQIKLDGIESVVVDGASIMARLAGPQALETIFASLPRAGQRVFISSEYPDDIRKLAESHARKAIHFPPRPAVAEKTERAAPTATIRYVVAPDARKPDQVARLARAEAGPLTLLCRSGQSARAAERALRGRGFDARAFTYGEFERHTAAGQVFGYDAPFTADALAADLRDGAVVVCERNELPHLKHIAETAHMKLVAATMPAYEADSLNAFRNEIRRAAREEDLDAQMMVLEPLFEEMSAEEIAAAASALLRARRPVKQEGGAPKGTKTWSRLFFSIGERDGVRPGDVVGAITGESGIRGEDVGRVEIRDTFSVIEIASTVADQVIRALNGTTMKNRALRVDYDRKTSAGGGKARGPAKRPAQREFKREKPR
ncbi:MAG: DbpA RNA binding domain-containing protein [Gemmatimonadota bacterium]